jgi:hypothetical protein
VQKVKNIADVRKTLRGSFFARAGQNTQAVKIVVRPLIDALASSLDRPTTVCSLLYGAGIPCSLMVRLCSAASHHPPQRNHAADDLLRRAACCLIAAGSPADSMLCGRFDVAIAHIFEAARLVVKVRVAALRWWLRGEFVVRPEASTTPTWREASNHLALRNGVPSNTSSCHRKTRLGVTEHPGCVRG